MIRINLLGSPKPKGKKSAAVTMPSMDFNVGSPAMLAAAVVVIVALLNGGYFYMLDREKKSIAEQMQRAEAKNRELADIKARYMERQKQADAYQRRVDVIKQLQAGQTGPVTFLAMLGETVNNTEAVWLSKMDDTGPIVKLEGTALSTDAVANLIANLQKTGYFQAVEIDETWQDDQIKDMQAFQFILNCQKSKS
jgi:Tfp pilus assembly protein PilN